jgi:hypothetical protein
MSVFIEQADVVVTLYICGYSVRNFIAHGVTCLSIFTQSVQENDELVPRKGYDQNLLNNFQLTNHPVIRQSVT